MDRITIKTMLQDFMESAHDKLTIPAIALTIRHLREQFEYHYPKGILPDIEIIKEIATELGWEFRILSDRYSHGPALVKILIPSEEVLTQELRKMTESDYLRIRHLKISAFQNAFGQYRITHGVDSIISESTWLAVFDKLGFIYEPDNEMLILKPLKLPRHARELMTEILASLRVIEHRAHRTTNYQRVQVIVEKELREKVSSQFMHNTHRISHQQWQELLSGIVGETLILHGYSLEQKWVYKTDLTPAPAQNGDIFLPAQITKPPHKDPDQFAKGFPIYVPACICDGATIVVLELLGPRQAGGANWAAIRGGKSTYITGQGTVMAKKEDGFSTLKTTLKECGWDHWCLIHGQASIKNMVPETEFYIVDDKTLAGIPANFYPQLAKALPFPVLPHWAEYLWVQGRINDLITALGGIGLGGWKVFFIKEKWEQIVSSGLSQGKIKIRQLSLR